MKFLLRSAALALCFLASAQADTLIGTPIAKVPIVISKPGKYRLAHSLASANGTVAAIKITAPYVSIDFNGYTLIATGAANGAGIIGIDLQGAPHATIRNGNITGFGRAISAFSTTAQDDALTIEDMTCEAQTGPAAIYTFGLDTIIRHCRVTNPTGAVSTPLGIFAGLSSVIEDCSVSDLHAANATNAVAYMLDYGSGNEEHTAVLRNCVGSNLVSDSGTAYAVDAAAQNSLITGCTFYNLPGQFQVGGGGRVTVRDTMFRACGASAFSSFVKDAGGNFFFP